MPEKPPTQPFQKWIKRALRVHGKWGTIRVGVRAIIDARQEKFFFGKPTSLQSFLLLSKMAINGYPPPGGPNNSPDGSFLARISLKLVGL